MSVKDGIDNGLIVSSMAFMWASDGRRRLLQCCGHYTWLSNIILQHLNTIVCIMCWFMVSGLFVRFVINYVQCPVV